MSDGSYLQCGGRTRPTVVSGLAAAARPLETARDLDPLIDAIGDARYVLGEASHGTSDFFTWRMEISKRLIAEHGFSFLAVEGDSPNCHASTDT